MNPRNEHESSKLVHSRQQGPAKGFPNDWSRMLESCRQYLLLVANRTIDSDLKAKLGPSDLVQESLLEAQRDIAGFHGSNETELRAWLRKILLNNVSSARNRYCQTGKRLVSREMAIDAVVNGPEGDQLAATDVSPSQHAVRKEEVQNLELAMTRLPLHYQEVLRLRHQQNCSFETIGHRTGRSAEAARKVWARAVELLKQSLLDSNDRRR